MPNFERVIRWAFVDVLDREPDPSNLAYFNATMNLGMKESDLREVLLRSGEFASKNPGGIVLPPAPEAPSE